MEPQELSAELFGFARGYARARGVRFGRGSESDVRNGIFNEVAFSWSSGTQDAEKLRGDAERGLARFVDAMIDSRHEVYGAASDSDNIIGEGTFAAARSRLCPIFPICR